MFTLLILILTELAVLLVAYKLIFAPCPKRLHNHSWFENEELPDFVTVKDMEASINTLFSNLYASQAEGAGKLHNQCCEANDADPSRAHNRWRDSTRRSKKESVH